jgi:hypothetical protein
LESPVTLVDLPLVSPERSLSLLLTIFSKFFATGLHGFSLSVTTTNLLTYLLSLFKGRMSVVWVTMVDV